MFKVNNKDTRMKPLAFGATPFRGHPKTYVSGKVEHIVEKSYKK